MVQIVWTQEAEDKLREGKDALYERLRVWKGEVYGEEYVSRRSSELISDVRIRAQALALQAMDGSMVLPLHVLTALLDTPAWSIVFPTPPDARGVVEMDTAVAYEESREGFRRMLRLMAVVPDDVMDAFLLARAQDRFARGRGRKKFRLALDTAAGDVLKAIRSAWPDYYSPETTDFFGGRASYEAIYGAWAVIDALAKAARVREGLTLMDQGIETILPYNPSPDPDDEG